MVSWRSANAKVWQCTKQCLLSLTHPAYNPSLEVHIVNVRMVYQLHFLHYYTYIYKRTQHGCSNCFGGCRNLHDTLKAIHFSKRYSGVRKAIVASCMGSMSTRKIASVLKVWKNLSKLFFQLVHQLVTWYSKKDFT
jgi:hypothetical protein